MKKKEKKRKNILRSSNNTNMLRSYGTVSIKMQFSLNMKRFSIDAFILANMYDK